MFYLFLILYIKYILNHVFIRVNDAYKYVIFSPEKIPCVLPLASLKILYKLSYLITGFLSAETLLPGVSKVISLV